MSEVASIDTVPPTCICRRFTTFGFRVATGTVSLLAPAKLTSPPTVNKLTTSVEPADTSTLPGITVSPSTVTVDVPEIDRLPLRLSAPLKVTVAPPATVRPLPTLTAPLNCTLPDPIDSAFTDTGSSNT